MTNTELRAWIDARRLTIAAAAEMLGLSKSGLHRQLSGERHVSEQTRQLCRLWDAYDAKPHQADIEQHLDAVERDAMAKGYQIGKRDAKPTEEPR